MRLYAWLLYLLPPAFRRAHGSELFQVARTAHQRGDIGMRHLVIDMLRTCAREWISPGTEPVRRPRGSVLQDLFRDIRHAVRLLRKQPAFTLAAVATLALGIGANTAMFTLAKATLLRPVDVSEPERLVSWTWTSAYPDYLEYTMLTDTFAGVLAWSGGSRVNVVADGPSELATAMFVSGNAFDVLGVRAVAGRVIQPTDDIRNGPIVGVLSHDYWQSRFGANSAVVGRLLIINSHPVTIVGVAQAGFRGVTLSSNPAIYLPVTSAGKVRGGIFDRPQFFETRNFVWLNVIARMRDGISRAQASAVVDTRYRQLQPLSPGERMEPLQLAPMTTRALGGNSAESVERFVLLLMGVVVLTLLIGCASLANLLLAKAAGRQQEVGVRLTLGATRGHVIRQMIVESLLLAAFGALAGVAVAEATLRLLATYQLPGGISIGALDLTPDAWTIGATAALSLVTALLFGAAPAWHASRVDVVGSLRETTRAATHPSRARAALVAAQVAISLVLLAGSGLFLRSLLHALAVPTGFNADGVVTASVNPGLVRYDAARIRAYYDMALQRVRALPDVTAAAWTNIIPINGAMINVVDIQGYTPPDGNAPDFYVSHVTPDYFAAAGTRLLRGRGFTATDTPNAPLVAIVSRSAAETFWNGRDAIGMQMRPGGSAEWRTVIGVVEDVTVERLDERRVPYVFYPFEQASGGSLRGPGEPAHLLVRTSGDTRDLLSRVAVELRSIDPQMPLYDVMPFTEHVRELVMPQQMGTVLLVMFSALAVSLAAIGIYGVASYVAQLRARELGIRIALGASGGDVRRLVVRQGLVPAALGVATGMAFAMWAARFARAFLYDVSPADPVTFGVVSVLLLLMALTATWLPARRAARLDPVAALRDQ